MEDALNLTDYLPIAGEQPAAVVWGETSLTGSTNSLTAQLRVELDGLYAKAFATTPKPVEFARLMAAAKKVHDELTKHDDKLSSFTVDIAAKTYMHLKKVQRLVARGLKVEPEILDLIDADKRMNKGSVLDRLCREPAETQMLVFEQLKADLPSRKPTTDGDRAKAVLAQFGKLPKAAQRIFSAEFLKHLKGGEL